MTGMKKIKIAFDIDGTLRCNCTDVCQDINAPMKTLAIMLDKWFKNVELHAWSGGGADYSWAFVRRNGLGKIITEARCHSKLDDFKPDIAIDDQQAFNLGDKNLIVFLK